MRNVKMIEHPYKNNYYEDIQESLKTYERKYRLNPKKTALRIVFWNFLFLFKKPPLRTKLNEAEDKNNVTIAFVLDGGFGDYLLFANWLEYFIEHYCQRKNIKIYVLYHIDSALSIFNYPIDNVELVNSREKCIEIEKFDVVFKFCIYPEIVKFHKQRVKNFSRGGYLNTFLSVNNSEMKTL